MARSPGTPRLHRRFWPLLAMTGIGAICAPEVRGDPLPTRNQNPLLAAYGLPSALPSRVPPAGGQSIGLALNWANAANIDVSASDVFIMDGETEDVRLRYERALGPRLEFLGELAWRRLSGGSLDHLVEQWHNLLGLPQRARNQLPSNDLLIAYRHNDIERFHVDQEVSGLADIPIAIGYQVASSDRSALAAWLTVKLPTGDADKLTGSGATDVAVSLAGQTQLAEHWHLFGQVDATWLGDGDILPELQKSYAWSVLAGVSWNAWRALDLTVQFAANSSVFGAGATNLAGDAVVMSFGGSYRTTGGWCYGFGISEDVQVDASPDANFIFAVQRAF